ncbi:MAG: erythromycin esterase family protein [Opitutales bacterium]|nr:erythromycin esterase family protein [Opitutales bacterium]
MNKVLWMLALIGPVLGFSLYGQTNWEAYLESHAEPWPKENPTAEWGPRWAEHRFVLLGESTHGTSEFYEMRATLTRHLMENGSHRFVVVEGDWEGLKKANAYVRGESEYASAEEVLLKLDRWPRWMWANREFATLLEWMREANQNRPEEKWFGVYGMDIYSWPGSFDALRDWLKDNDPNYLSTFDRQMRALVRYRDNWPRYSHAAWAMATRGPETVPTAMAGLKDRIRAAELSKREETYFLIRARSVIAAERHLREARLNNAESWNARARHMKRTVEQLSELLPEELGIIVWAHNTHIGDARATPMGEHGMVNIGSLMREKKGTENVFLLGQTTGSGTFLGARTWEGEREIFAHKPPHRHSLEGHLATSFEEPMVIPFAEALERGDELPVIGHRAIGVVYQVDAPQQHYVPSQLPQRYDTLLFFPETTALHPLHERE